MAPSMWSVRADAAPGERADRTDHRKAEIGQRIFISIATRASSSTSKDAVAVDA